MREALIGYVESNVYEKNDFFAGRYAGNHKKLVQYLADIQTTSGISPRFMELFAVVGLVTLIIVNKYSGGQDELAIINIGAFMAAAYKVIPGIVKISSTLGQIKTFSYTVTELVQNKEKVRSVAVMDTDHLSSVVFNNVSYKHGDNSVLSSFNFDIEKGDFAGIEGPSGKGKTTLVNLLLGFLDENNGAIVFNGVPKKQGQRKQYWRYIAYAQQRPALIYNTLQANITLSDADYDSKKLADVIKAVGLDSFIAQFPEGDQKLVTEGGKNLSGGQRQRIAIARALYKDADLLIFDEPFSELDTQSEVHILEHLAEICKQGKMVILITHKKDNFIYCNKTYKINY